MSLSFISLFLSISLILFLSSTNKFDLRVDAQSTTCAIVDAITLATLAPTTTNTTIVSLDPTTLALKQWPVTISIGFCSSIQPTNAGLASWGSCSSSGYVTITNLTSNQCLASYPTISSTLAYSSPTSVTFTVASTSSSVSYGDLVGSKANVTISCNSAMKNTQAALYSNVSYSSSTNTWSIHLQSGAACNSSTFFCTHDANCTDAAKTCQNGVCFNANCSQLATITAPFTKSNSGVLGLLSVTDCSGTPLPNLTATDFDVLLNGVSAKQSTQFSSESDMYVKSNPQSQPSLSVLLIDQSASVTRNAASLAAVKAATTRFVELVQGQNAYHYVAVIAFDGSAKPVVVVEHTTNTTALKNGIASMPPSALTDPGSTNLNGAVHDAVLVANAMRFSFGPLNSSVSSTLVVFTDGYDTSARLSQLEAVNAVLDEVDTVRVVGIGVASTSDHIFLQTISTSGIFYFSQNVSTITTSFESIAQRLATTGQAVYAVGICQPLRSTNVTATFLLNTTKYKTTQTQSVVFDASTFTGKTCTNDSLANDLFLLSLNQSTSTNQTDALAVGAPILRTVVPNGATFFTFSCVVATQQPVVLLVSPATVAVYILNSTTTRCTRVSPYCYDAVITSGRGLVTDCSLTYTGMALPPISSTATASTTVAITAVPLSGVLTTTTPSPFLASTTTTTAAAAAASWMFAGSLFDYFNASSYTTDGEAHVDAAAAWIIFGFLILAFFAVLIYIGYMYVSTVGVALATAREASERNSLRRSLNSAQWRGGSGGGNYDRRVLDKPLVIYAASNNPYGMNNQMSPHRLHFRQQQSQPRQMLPLPTSSRTSTFMRNSNVPQRGEVEVSDYYYNPPPQVDHHGLSPSAEALPALGRSREHGGFVPVL